MSTITIIPKEMKAFPKIFHVGAPEVTLLFTGEVEVTEKVDGSQIGFGRVENGDLIIRSKGVVMYNGASYSEPKLFKSAINQILSVQDKIKPGYFFYGEAVTSPRHNTLSYEKTPTGFIALYGVLTPEGWVSDHKTLTEYAVGLGIDVVPLLYKGEISSKEQLDALMNTDSFLGKEKIEGVVVKNYTQKSNWHMSLECFGKFVREGFKERNGANKDHQKGNDLLDLIGAFKTDARWEKAVQRARDNGTITGSAKDIGPMIQDIILDLETEEQGYIKEQLYKLFRKQITGATVAGFPEWYKEKLLVGAFKPDVLIV